MKKPAKFQGKFCWLLEEGRLFLGGTSSHASCKLQKNRATTGRHIQHHQTFLPFRNSPPPRLSAMKTTKMENMWPLMEVQLSMNFTCFHVYIYIYICQWFLPSTTKRKHQKKTFKKPSQKINQAFKKPSPQNQPPKSSSHHPFTIHQSVIIILPTQNLCTLKGTLKNHHTFHHSLIISPKIGNVINSIIPYRSHP